MAFAAVGVATALLYAVWVDWVPLLPDNLYEPLLDLGKITGYRWSSALRYLQVVLGLYALYAVGYWLVARGHARLARQILEETPVGRPEDVARGPR